MRVLYFASWGRVLQIEVKTLSRYDLLLQIEVKTLSEYDLLLQIEVKMCDLLLQIKNIE